MWKRWLERSAGPTEMVPATPLSDGELKAGLLREIDLFAGLPQSALKEISTTLPMTTCHNGGLLTSPEDEQERLFIVKRGRLRLYRLTPDGKQLTLDILDKGRVVGRMSWLGQDLTDVYAEAVEDSLVCSFTPQELERLIQRYPQIGLNIIRYLSDRLAASEWEREIMAYRSVEQRLASRILELLDRFGAEEEGGTAVDARLTQQELADMIGTTRETLAQTISRLREQGLLDMRNQRIVVFDRRALETLAVS
ncbi:MAG: Crp/Fnr family transcriptional regulator [Candidatus Limnocylindria bacterium]